MSTFVEQLYERILDKSLVEKGDLIGLSDAEIRAIMAAQGVNRLPMVYRQFLETVGKDGPNLWRFSTYRGDSLKNLKHCFQSNLELHNTEFELPVDAFVYLVEENINYVYFLTDDIDDDPPVYCWSEYEYWHGKIADHLSDDLLQI